MSDPANPFQPMLDAWMKTQSDYFSKISGQGPAGDGGDPFEGLREQAAQFMAQSGMNAPDLAAFQDMFDPKAMAGMPWLKGAEELTALLSMPGLGDLADIEKNRLHTTKEWQQFQSACKDIQNLNAAAWQDAFATFQSEFGDAGALGNNPQDMSARWLAVLNEKLTAAMAAPDFLKAQAEVIRSGAAFKAKEREIVEEWCKAHSMPTRSEIDALHETIAELRREIAALK